MKAYQEKSSLNKLFAATVGVGECVMVPAGYLFYEHITSSCDFLGLRMPILSINDFATLSDIDKALTKIGCTSPALQRAVDCLTIIT
jgi:hypothetical protein